MCYGRRAPKSVFRKAYCDPTYITCMRGGGGEVVGSINAKVPGARWQALAKDSAALQQTAKHPPPTRTPRLYGVVVCCHVEWNGVRLEDRGAAWGRSESDANHYGTNVGTLEWYAIGSAGGRLSTCTQGPRVNPKVYGPKYQ